MYYQNIPFLIVAKDVATGEKIASILGRKKNTKVECYDPEQIYNFQDSINYFTCNIFHYSEDDSLLSEIIIKSLKRRPLFPVLLFSFSDVDMEIYRKYIRMGVTDILVRSENSDKDKIISELMNTLNHRWKIFRYLERERKKIYHATVVTAFHEINQPLTVIMNSIDLFMIDMKKDEVTHEKIKKNLSFILRSIKRIQEILEKMKKVEQPRLKAYTKTVPMISLQSDDPQKQQNLDLVQEMRVTPGKSKNDKE